MGTQPRRSRLAQRSLGNIGTKGFPDDDTSPLSMMAPEKDAARDKTHSGVPHQSPAPMGEGRGTMVGGEGGRLETDFKGGRENW